MSTAKPYCKNRRDAALSWAARGFPVFRLQANGKLPLEGSNGHLDATLDPDLIREWWTDPLTYAPMPWNIGCSPRDGRHLIIDLDVKDGLQGIAEYLAMGGQVAGLVVRTASGGKHVYCTCPEPLRTGAGKIAPGIDTRGPDGYAVAPGSVIDGVCYTIEMDDPPLPVPDFVRERIGTRAERDQARTFYRQVEDDQPANIARATHVAKNHPPAVTGCWHDLGFKLGAELARVAVSPDVAIEIAETHWVPRGTGFSSRDRFVADVLGGYHAAVKDREHGVHSVDAAAAAFEGLEITLPPDFSEASAPGVAAPGANASADEAEGPRWKIIRPAEICDEDVPARESFVPGWLSPGYVTMMYADGGVGKSLLALQLMTALATGRPWVGMDVHPCRSVGLFCEDPGDELHRRQQAINRTMGLTRSELTDMEYTSGLGEDNTLMTVDRDGQLITTPGFRRLYYWARAFGARAVIIDTAVDTFGGNEIDRRQVRGFISSVLGRIALDLNAAVLLIAQPSRDGMRSGRLDGGSTAWHNTVRERWTLDYAKGSNGEVDPDERVLTRRKANYGRTGEERRIRWVHGVFVPVQPLTVDEARARMQHAEIVFLRLLNRYNLGGRNVSPHSRAGNYAPKVLSEQPDTEGMLRADFDGALDRMLNDGRLRVEVCGPQSRRSQRLVPAPNYSDFPTFE